MYSRYLSITVDANFQHCGKWPVFKHLLNRIFNLCNLILCLISCVVISLKKNGVCGLSYCILSKFIGLLACANILNNRVSPISLASRSTASLLDSYLKFSFVVLSMVIIGWWSDAWFSVWISQPWINFVAAKFVQLNQIFCLGVYVIITFWVPKMVM
ncbi:hypothetical protein O181_024363 [Austropuccinia psidii MF-1]|uniref:Uncharacterized protein n=1 Tax=Austropuccinia psidii MF-1 TaxID=1389203 RepID=A0A9Q3CKN0_9BASI|nr:hypothetical protein [Austropuccinia psidii MF-1]